ncbi:DUF2812 domain-containing protein [Terrisporobacter hibernicus]|uniref:DUF2812 domain-containing protein n=1 Tax=Terrisporobacter hibernicus TaxID=2813371 RepID=A0AAX2ZET0_9FIRM|nr:DUF2812 domain-containing protein [Terrisporobacter hibernicus]UEL47793.1 DUF2812 domain-containing protein [Terrisporobacter hibernicus]
MKIWGNKKIVFLCFDKTDCAILEEYLNEMAKKGWLLTKIKNYHLTFVKTDKINFKYNVDPLGKNFDGDSYVDKITYIKYCKDHNWEYVCGNNFFQISISEESNKEKIKSKPEESIKSLLIKDVISLVAFILLFHFIFKYEGFYLDGSYMDTVSNYRGGGFYVIGILALIYLCIDLILSIIWYINYFIKKEFKYKSLNQIKISSVFGVTLHFFIMTLLILNVVISFLDGFGISPRTSFSKESLPIVLEDYNIKIQSERDCSTTKYKSFLGKYYSFSDSTYYETYGDDGTYIQHENNGGVISYEVFESKYKNIMSNALKDIKINHTNMGSKYKKYTSGEEFNTWGAKEIYIDKSTEERIIVYDNVILMLDMEGDYNKSKINFIKEKLLNL